MIGEHEGALFFTLGERHGFTICKREENEQKPLYVVSKNIEKNEIVVSEQKESNNQANTIVQEMSVPEIYVENRLECQIRYHGQLCVHDFTAR